MTPQQLASKGTESGEQKALMAWAAVAHLNGWQAADDPSSYSAPGWKGVRIPEPTLRWLHAVPNGGLRDPVTAACMKAEGVKAGIPDICLPVPKGIFHGLYIELKRQKAFKVSKEQKEFAEHCKLNNYYFEICLGWESAAETIHRYLKGIK